MQTKSNVFHKLFTKISVFFTKKSKIFIFLKFFDFCKFQNFQKLWNFGNFSFFCVLNKFYDFQKIYFHFHFFSILMRILSKIMKINFFRSEITKIWFLRLLAFNIMFSCHVLVPVSGALFQTPKNRALPDKSSQTRVQAIQVRKGTPFTNCSKSHDFQVKTSNYLTNVIRSWKFWFFSPKKLKKVEKTWKKTWKNIIFFIFGKFPKIQNFITFGIFEIL